MRADAKTVVVTGVLTRHSIAYAIAERLQADGANLVLTGFGRTKRLTERTAHRLGQEIPILELDLADKADVDSFSTELSGMVDTVHGVVHSVAWAPPEAIGGNFLSATQDQAMAALQVSAVSLQTLALAVLPLMQRAGGASIVALDFDASRVWMGYDWMGVAKETLAATSRHLAAYLGPHGIRSNLISSGPLQTAAAHGIPDAEAMEAFWDKRSPLGWNSQDAKPVADAAVFLLSDAAQMITGERLHVDGGMHVLANQPAQAGER